MSVTREIKPSFHNTTRIQTAAYIEELVREMETLAAQEGIRPLSELLRLAREEAEKAASA